MKEIKESYTLNKLGDELIEIIKNKVDFFSTMSYFFRKRPITVSPQRSISSTAFVKIFRIFLLGKFLSFVRRKCRRVRCRHHSVR